MLVDVVIDTNGLLHASDPRQPHQGDCLRVIDRMRACKTLLCVDSGTNPKNPLQGFIMTEYDQRLIPGTPGFELLRFLLQASRVAPCSRQVSRKIAKRLEQLIPNKQDRKFVAVASNTTEMVLLSHDFRDFPKRVRREIEELTDVRILEARPCAGLL